MELLVLITVMAVSFGLALGIMKAALEVLLRSMTAASAPPVPRFEVRRAAAAGVRMEQLTA